jgi:hypothetical protein
MTTNWTRFPIHLACPFNTLNLLSATFVEALVTHSQQIPDFSIFLRVNLRGLNVTPGSEMSESSSVRWTVEGATHAPEMPTRTRHIYNDGALRLIECLVNLDHQTSGE